MNKTAQIIPIIILITIIGNSVACSSKSTTANTTSTTTSMAVSTTVTTATSSTVSGTVTSTTSSDDASIRAWADSETETTFQGLSEDNLAKYTQYGDTQFKAAVTQALLDQTAAALKSQIGTYISKEFLSTGSVQGYIQVYYNAKYTGATVKVLMSFDANHQVAGQHFVQ